MPRSNASQTRFYVISVITLVSSATVLAITLPPARASMIAAAKSQASELVGEAAGANAAEAAVDYQIASWLDPTNKAAYLGTARIQIAAGNPETAFKALDRAGQGSEASSLRIRTLIELGRTNEAADHAASLTAPEHTDADIILAAQAYALAGRPSDIPALTALVSTPQAAGRIARAQAGNVPLAGELYTSGLPESSRALLVKQPNSFERNLLLGRLYYDQHTTTSLSTATGYLSSAVKLNPSSAEAHQLLAAVYAERKMPSESATETILAKKITSGRP